MRRKMTGQAGVAVGDGPGQQVAPLVELAQELGVDGGDPLLAPLGGGELLQGTGQDRVAAEEGGDLVPVGLVLVVAPVAQAGDGGGVLLRRAQAGVVDGELLEVGQHAEGQLGRPGVAAQLEGGLAVDGQVDGRLLGLDEEAAAAVEVEAVVGGLGLAGDGDLVLVLDFGAAVAVVHIPAQGGEEGVDELDADFGLVVRAALEGGQGVVEAGEEVGEHGIEN